MFNKTEFRVSSSESGNSARYVQEGISYAYSQRRILDEYSTV